MCVCVCVCVCVCERERARERERSRVGFNPTRTVHLFRNRDGFLDLLIALYKARHQLRV